MDFVAKQMLSNKMGAVKGELGKLGGDEKEGEAKAEGGEDPEVLEAMREAEEKRKDKYRKMEEEREVMRQGIRDKYGLKKKEPEQPVQEPGVEGRLTRAKKTPEELAKEKEVDSDEDEFQSNPLTRWLSNCTPQ